MADMKISDLPVAPDVNDAQQFEVNDSGNSRRVTFQQVREAVKTQADNWYAAKTHTHTAAQISDATPIGRNVLTAANQAAARSAIGAGTSNLTLGNTATTAKPGDWVPALPAAGGVGSYVIGASAPTVFLGDTVQGSSLHGACFWTHPTTLHAVTPAYLALHSATQEGTWRNMGGFASYMKSDEWQVDLFLRIA